MLLGIAPATWVLALCTALAAGFVRGLAGFGLSVVLVPVLGLAIAPPLAVLVGNISLFLIGLTDIGRIRADADRSAIPLVIIALVAVPLGLLAVTSAEPELARLLIALVSLGAFVLVVVPLGPVRLPRVLAVPLSGIATGFLGGFSGMPGPGMAPFYLRGTLPPKVARASMMAIFLVLTPLSAGMFLLAGIGGWREAALALALFPAVLVGDWFGHRAFGRISARQWQFATFGVLAGTALVALWRLIAS